MILIIKMRSEHTTPGGSEDYITVGLSDFGELPGQSTWYIRSVRFKIQGYADTGFTVNTTFDVIHQSNCFKVSHS